jgi:hypothetical protein
VHGFNLDPWECRSTLLIAGPGFSDAVVPTPREATVSVLGLRDGIGRVLAGKRFDSAFLEAATPKAPFRYHTLATDAFGADSVRYLAEPEKDLAVNTYLAPGGIWFTQYTKSAKDRAEDASVGFAVGETSTYFKPVVGGGAMKSVFQGYTLVSDQKIDEKAFRAAKKEVEDILAADDPTGASAGK